MLTQIRNSKPISFAALVIICIVAWFSYQGVGSVTQSGLKAYVALGIALLLGGWLIFGRTAMGLVWKKPSLYTLYCLLIPLAAVYLINAACTPIASSIADDLSQLDFGKLLETVFWEESVFRGALLAFLIWLLMWMTKNLKYSRFIAVAASSVFFGLFHSGQSLELFAYRTGLGITFAMFVLQSQSLIAVMILHALNNGLSVVMGGSSLDMSIKLVGIGVLALMSLWIVCKMLDKNINPKTSETEQSLAQ